MHLFVLALVVLQVPSPHGIPADSAESLRRAARSAERRYENLLRSLAPTRFGSPVSRHDCDEILGRFCLMYDGGGPPKRVWEDSGRVVRARQDAVDALRLAFAALPGEFTTAGPLLRYLVEDERAEEAVSAASAFRWASADSIWGPLLEAFALHAAGDDTAAERRFDTALERLPPKERRQWERIDILLDPGERSHYLRLDEEERARYEAAVWRLADPLYLTPGNETRAEHLARHVWARLLENAPRVRGTTSWGRDLEEITIRYGVPTSRERVIGWSIMSDDHFVEHFHPEQLAYVPQALRTEGFPPVPAPGEEDPLESIRARSGYAPRTVRKLRSLEHQVTRFPAPGGAVLRVDGDFAPDSVPDAGDTIRAALFVLDSLFEPFREETADFAVRSDTLRLTFEMPVPPGAYVYSLEALALHSRYGGRARYAVDVPEYPAGIALSDPIVAEPFGEGALPAGRDDGRLRPRTRLILSEADTIGLYAEAHGLAPAPDGTTRYRVVLSVRSAEDAPLLARAARWIGRTLGLVGPDVEPRLTWEGEGAAGRPAILAVDFPLRDLGAGLYEIRLDVGDLVGGGTHSSQRLVRIEKPERR